ncbi:DUF2490 domain-containing protein [Dyadobacter beijingensis]|uniref:DUF2490 domain-containing protein n=1 Tax=Dyadobacter beijingensis TaxID=365489 RepID=UPI00146A05DA|nr:DUF2490 domain-containing protein [Dyadobacter beijingensis]
MKYRSVLPAGFRLPVARLCVAVAGVCFLCTYDAYAEDPDACWLMPGLNYRFSEKRYGFLQAGWNPALRLGLVYGNFIIRPRPALDINIGSMYIDYLNREGREWTLMNGFTARIPAGPFVVENRGLVWNRFISNGNDLHFYRNRVRLMWPLKTTWHLTPYLVDEPSFSFNRGDIARNRLGGGFIVTINKRVVVDASYARQSDKVSGKLNLFFVMVTAQLPHQEH